MARIFREFEWHRYPKDRTSFEKILRRFIIPTYNHVGRTSQGWKAYHERIKGNFPVRWFLSETIPDFWNYKILRNYREVRNWIRFRTWDKYHILRLEQEPGYSDPDERLINSAFQILKDFVEIELAAMNRASEESESNESSKKFFGRLRKFNRRARRKQLRDPKAGLGYLDWEIAEATGGGGPSGLSQSEAAAIKKDLYLWWTKERPNRFDLYSDPHLGWEKKDKSDPLDFKVDRSWQYHLLGECERFYEAQDEEMLVKLMKVRRTLWS